MSIADDMKEGDPINFIRDFGAGELHLRKRINVGILGATGSVGQRLISILSKHPWFLITALAASEKNSGKKYAEAVQWRMNEPLADYVSQLALQDAKPGLDCHLIFSALDSKVAGEIESEFAKAGYPVISCAKSHRMDSDVPLLIPEVNADHLELISGKKGMIITKPNCSVIGLALALRPLQLERGTQQTGPFSSLQKGMIRASVLSRRSGFACVRINIFKTECRRRQRDSG